MTKLYVFKTRLEGSLIVTTNAGEEHPLMKYEYPQPISKYSKKFQAKCVQEYMSNMLEEPYSLAEAKEWLKRNPQELRIENTNKVISHGMEEITPDKGTLCLFMDGFGSDDHWLYFDADNEFSGVSTKDLTPEQIEKVWEDCESSKGFFDPCFDPMYIEDYDIKEEL